MVGMDMSEKRKKEEIRRESTKGNKGLLMRQAFWGILVLVSLLVMFVMGIFAIRGAQKGQRDAELSYAASDMQGSAGNGKGIAADGPGKTLSGDGTAQSEPGKMLPEGGNSEEKPGRTLSEGKEAGDGSGKTLSGDKSSEADPGKALTEGRETGDGSGKTPSGNQEAEDGPAEDGDVQEEEDADTDAPVIAMTFDDGPYTKVTNRIVDVLLEYGAGATFFVVGSRIDTYSDTLKRVYESGFEVASHTWSHKNLNKLSEEEILKELSDTVEKLNTYVPVGDVLLRPPYGSANETVRALAGTSLINWSLDSQDWKSRDADAIIAHVLATVKDGDIILMHDLYECTAEAVEYLVPELTARGYRIVSVSELFCRKGIPLEEGILYRNPWDSY